MWHRGQGHERNRTHRKFNRRRVFNGYTHLPVSNIVLNLNEIVARKLTSMKMKVEGRECEVLLDSCSSTNIISEYFLTEKLFISKSKLHGPIGCVKGLGEKLTYD